MKKSPKGSAFGGLRLLKVLIVLDRASGLVALTFMNSQKAATCAWLFALLKGQVYAKGVHAGPCKNS